MKTSHATFRTMTCIILERRGNSLTNENIIVGYLSFGTTRRHEVICVQEHTAVRVEYSKARSPERNLGRKEHLVLMQSLSPQYDSHYMQSHDLA